MKYIIICLLFEVVIAQQPDTAKIYPLNEVIVIRNSEQRDTTIDFYKANTSATTEEILSRSGSVQMIRRGNYGLEPNIRGFSAGQVSLTIDGMHIHGACTDKMDPITIYVEPQNLYSIDIATGTNGLVFGSSLGGAVNVQLAEPTLSETKISAGSGYQSSAKAYNGNISVNTGTNQYALLINGVYRKSNNYKAGNGTTIPFSYYEKTNLSLAGRYQLSENEELKSDMLFDDGWNIGYPALTMDVGYAKARIYSLSYNFINNDNILSLCEVKAYRNDITHFMDDTHRPSIPMHMDMPGWSTTYGSYINTHFNFLENHATQIRVDFYRTFVRAEMTMYPPNGLPMFMLTLPDARRISGAIFVKDEWDISNDINASFNGRLENNNSLVTSEFGRQQLSVFGYNTENAKNTLLKSGTMNLTNRFSENINANFSIGYAERMPTMNESYGFYLYNRFDGFDYIGNPELQNEHSLQSEISTRFQTEFIQIKGTGFFNRINNFIIGAKDGTLSAMTIGAHGVKLFNNLPFATMRGFEFSLILHPQDNLDLISTTKYVQGTDNDSKPLQLIPPLKNLTSVRYRFENITIQNELEYASSQNSIRTSVGEQPTASYLLAHIRASYVLMIENLQVSLNGGVENIFDANYRDHLDWGNIPRPGRNIYLSASIAIQ
jgi:iron complex outermembrane receptor protein